MSVVGQARTGPVLWQCRETIAQSWQSSLTAGALIPLDNRELRQELLALTDQTLDALLAEPVERAAAREVGTTLVRLGYSAAEALGTTQAVLTRHILNGVPPTSDAALSVRLATVLGKLAVGFAAAAQETLLAEQEAIRAAALADSRRAAEALRAVIDTALDAVIGLDTRGRITLWNAQAEVLFGWSQREAVGRLLQATIVPAAQHEVAGVRLAPFLATDGEPVLNKRFEFTASHRDGHEFLVEVAITPLGTGGGVSGFTVFLRDITEHKRTEEAERRAKEAAEAAHRAKAEFLANMSHEIRTPLNGVIGMTGLLLETPLSSEQRQYADVVHSSAESLLRIISDILDFSKLEAAQMRLEHLDFDLQTTVEDVTGLLGARAYQQQVELTVGIEQDVPTALRGDPFRLRQVLTNLLGNAIKFTERGEVDIHIEVVEEHAEAVLLRFSVTDTGIGLTAEEQSRLFHAFAQADASTTRRYGGTGLGLVIAQQLVELMGGTIGIDSTPDQGSTFWFTVWIAKHGQQPVDAPLLGAASASDPQPGRVLVVDDNATNRTMLQHQVSRWGMRVDCADGGPQALDLLRAAAELDEAFDLAILDMHMPGMDGLALARAIRADPANAGVRLVLLTSLGQHLGEMAQQVGILASLAKPVRQSQLYDTLATVLAGHATPAVAQPAPPSATDPSSTSRVPEGAPFVLLAEDNAVNQLVARRLLHKLGYRVDVVAGGREAVEAVRHTAYAAVLMDC